MQRGRTSTGAGCAQEGMLVSELERGSHASIPHIKCLLCAGPCQGVRRQKPGLVPKEPQPHTEGGRVSWPQWPGMTADGVCPGLVGHKERRERDARTEITEDRPKGIPGKENGGYGGLEAAFLTPGAFFGSHVSAQAFPVWGLSPW